MRHYLVDLVVIEGAVHVDHFLTGQQHQPVCDPARDTVIRDHLMRRDHLALPHVGIAFPGFEIDLCIIAHGGGFPASLPGRDEIEAAPLNLRNPTEFCLDFGRSSSWRAMHAVSLGHGFKPFMAGVRAGAEVATFPSACFYASTVLWK